MTKRGKSLWESSTVTRVVLAERPLYLRTHCISCGDGKPDTLRVIERFKQWSYPDVDFSI